MTLQEAKDEVAEQERQRHKDEMRIFYPDPDNENDCAQCGKPKEQHRKDVSDRPVFCNDRISKKSFSQLNEEATELYASSKVDAYKSSLRKEIERRFSEVQVNTEKATTKIRRHTAIYSTDDFLSLLSTIKPK